MLYTFSYWISILNNAHIYQITTLYVIFNNIEMAYISQLTFIIIIMRKINNLKILNK